MSAWPDDLRQALERGLFIRRLRESQNPWHQEALLEEMLDLVAPAAFKGATTQPMSQQDLNSEEGKLSLLLWAIKRHQESYACLGGSGRSTQALRSPRALTSSSSSRRRSFWPWRSVRR